MKNVTFPQEELLSTWKGVKIWGMPKGIEVR